MQIDVFPNSGGNRKHLITRSVERNTISHCFVFACWDTYFFLTRPGGGGGGLNVQMLSRMVVFLPPMAAATLPVLNSPSISESDSEGCASWFIV